MKKITLLILLLSLGIAQGPAFGADDSGPPTNRVSMQRARSTALRKFPGKVKDFEFEIKKNKWVYYFKIEGKDQQLHHIVVDAVTGKIISKSSEPMAVQAEPTAVSTPLAEKTNQN